jgi:hypothetical protein
VLDFGGGDPPFDLKNGGAMRTLGFRILPQIVVIQRARR